MASRIFDHVDLRVSSISQARKFYDVFLPALGFANVWSCGPAVCYSFAADTKDSPFVELNELPGHPGGANRVAFWADTEDEVTRLGGIVREAGARVVEGPEYCAGYTPDYYAVFFEDEDGNKWEICCRTARVP